MAQPPAYNASALATQPWDAGQRAKIDAELSQIETTLDAIVVNLAAIQRDDTKLKNGSVHRDAFSTDALQIMGAWKPRGAWATATAYAVKDVVVESSKVYVCVIAHTAGTFATDLSNGRWMFVTGETSYNTDADIVTAYNSEVAAASQAEAEAGTETEIRRWSPLRIAQAIAAAITTRLTQAINMAGAILRGYGAAIVTISSATNLNNTTHQAACLIVSANVAVTAKLQTTTEYNAGHQSTIFATHSSGCTFTVDSGATLNGVNNGTATINQYEAYAVLLEGENAWLMPNATVEAP